ncbi:MAG: HAMP domain-containing histidine kinase [Acidimicrobiia bacterium]|nr:HAMP domain-containing histidine kinase [Acidimicrobiia bacterium]
MAELRRPRLSGVRARTTMVAAAVVTVALVVASVALVVLTRRSLTESAENKAIARAQAIAELASVGAASDPLPGAAGVFAQLLDANGDVLAATADLIGQSALVDVAVGPGLEELVRIGELGNDHSGQDIDLVGDDGPFVVSVVGTTGPDGPVRAVAATSLDSVARTTSTLVPLLLVGIPLLAGLVALVAWRMVGRSFRPVEEMRAEAEQISLGDIDRRISIPGTDDEIKRLADTLNRMLERIEGSVTRQRRFVADASHELKSPVAAILTMAEVAEAHPNDIDTAPFAGDVRIEAERLALLVDDLLTLARDDEGRSDLVLSEVDLAGIVHQELARVRTDLTVDTSGVTSAVAPLDSLRMAQAIRNLLDNALRHAATTVWLATDKGPNGIVVTVADDGPGIPSEDRSRVFGRFERLDTARSRGHGGTGLGLAVVDSIAKSHGGSVTIVDDDRYPGATFSMVIPAAS